MNEKLFFLFMLTLIISVTGNGRTLKYVELGINQSKFRTESCESKIGPTLGIELDYYPIKSFGAFIGSGLLYQNKRTLAKDRTWPSDFDPDDSDIIAGDIDVNISYLEIPLQVGYSFKIKENLTPCILVGYCFSIPIKDHTRIKNRKWIRLYADERGTYDFDYFRIDENYVSWSKNYHLGLRLSCKRLALLISYAKALSITKGIDVLSIQDKVDSFRISLAYLF